jgi:[ribosomal protein S5]-alanine N-acetyltransferase
MIETQRLIVRLPELADVRDIVRYYRDNMAHLQPFSPTYTAGFLEVATWTEQVHFRAREYAAREAFRAFIFARPEPSRIVGNINLTQVIRGAFQSANLGYALAGAEQGRGYMSEAVSAMVAFAFGEWDLHRVAASYMPRNARSGSVLERCGFHVEGHAKDYLQIDGRWEDHVLTAVTNPGWSAPGRP